jgi:hypothetical protein
MRTRTLFNQLAIDNGQLARAINLSIACCLLPIGIKVLELREVRHL